MQSLPICLSDHCAPYLVYKKLLNPKAATILIWMMSTLPQTENCVFEVGVESHSTLYQNPFSNTTAVTLLEKAKAKAAAR
jgi:hypothetical protein